MMEESGLSSNGREQVQFWRELERVEQWLSTGAGAAAGRIYDTMGRPGARTFANYGNELVASVARVARVREALDQSGPMAKRLAVQQLSGIDLSDVWDILIAACKEIALYYGGAVVAGAVVGGAIGSLAFGAGAVPGAIAGGAAGSQVGLWVLTLLGLKDLAVSLGTMFPAAMEHYERGFREAWGAVPNNRRDFGNSAALPSGSSSAGAWHMGQGHVILVTAILTAVVAYLTRGGTTASLAQMARQSRQLGAKFANWAVKNEGRLLAHPQLQSRPNNSVAMAMQEVPPPKGSNTPATTNSATINTVGENRTGQAGSALVEPLMPETVISAEMENKILWGQRVANANGSMSNRLIGGHSGEITNAHPSYSVETIAVHADGTRSVKFVTQFADGNLSKIKSSTLFPSNWTEADVMAAVRSVGSSENAVITRISDKTTLYQGTVNGVDMEVMKIGSSVTSAYPTGGKWTPLDVYTPKP